MYPSGVVVNGCSYSAMHKVTGDVDATVTLYINKDGITAYLSSQVDIRGAQIEFGNVTNNPANLVINTGLGEGYYLRTGQVLKTLMYDRLGQKYIEAGDHMMADMPFVLQNPEGVSLENLILVDMNNHKLQNIQVEINYGTPPSLPLDYVLFQNYPNPFNPTTTVQFQVPQTSDVTIQIYDMLGQLVRTLYSNHVLRGTYSVSWDGMNSSGVRMSSGTYIYRMTAGSFIQSKKMVLLK